MSFQKGDYVRVTKLGSIDEPYHKTPSWDEYNEDKDSCNSIPTDYLAEGRLLIDFAIDGTLYMARERRNGVVRAGIFRTSYIKKIVEEGDFEMVFETMNSRYRVEKIIPPMAKQVGESNWNN